MEIVRILLLLGIFFFMAFLMFLRKIPALLALPAMAFFIPLVCGVPVSDTLHYVIGQGSLKLHNAYTVAMFGSMLSIFLQKTGVAENFIKKGAELSGDSPWTIAVIMLLLITLLFTTLGGLGAIIMVATIVLPIMSSVGIGPITTVGIFLLGISIGGMLNAGNWALYIDVMKLTVGEVRRFALIMCGMSFTASLVYITIQLYRDGHELKLKKIGIVSAIFVLVTSCVSLAYTMLDPERQGILLSCASQAGACMKYIVVAGIASLFLLGILAIFSSKKQEGKISWTAYFIPVIPLFLILIFEMNFIAALICGLLYGVLSCYRKGITNILVRSILEGGGLVMPAVVLMLGIGMLLNAIMGPGAEWTAQRGAMYPQGWPVLNLLQPLMLKVVPSTGIGYVLIFTLAAPLALYRGPLNVWGMGYGLATLFLASGLNAGAVMGLLLSVGQIQGISDPTNTQNVWLANEMRVDVQKVLWNTLPYTWILAFLGLVVSACLFIR